MALNHGADPAPSIHADTRIGAVTLRVADLARSSAFYRETLGLVLNSGERGEATLCAPDRVPLLVLRETPGARHVARASGLYHFAVLLPTRADLGRALERLIDSGSRFGQSDHLVSEALYLSDPDGNGIELYCDRPRSRWVWHGGKVEMAVDPLDLDSLRREAAKGGPVEPGAPSGTRIGHIHLQVSDVDRAVQFYHGLVGFDITASFQGAAFLSAGGYHHHLGLNSWSSRGAPPAPPDSAGLASFAIEVPGREERDRVVARLNAAGIAAAGEGARMTVCDPWDIGVELIAVAAAQGQR
jgi:catechol 2,3-dioxygenase